MYRLNEIGDTLKGQYALGQVYARANKRRSGITDAWIKQMPKKEYYTAAEYYPKGTEKYDDIMHDAKAEAECPTNRKVNMKPVVYNDKGYETTNFGLGMMDYEKSHKTNENNQYTNMNKKLIRLTESDLHKIVKESVNTILSEGGYYDYVFGDEEPKMKLDWHDKNSSVTEDKDNAALDSARYYIQKYNLEGKGLDSLLRNVGLAAINAFLTDTESGKRIAQLSRQLGFENDIFT